MSARQRLSLALALAVTLGARASGSPLPRAQAASVSAVARVGGREITLEEVVERARRNARAAGETPRAPGRAGLALALDALVDEASLVAEAHRRGLEREDRVARRLLVLQVFLADVAEGLTSARPTREALALTERDHARELAPLAGARREHEVLLLWKLDERRRLAADSVARARTRSGIRGGE